MPFDGDEFNVTIPFWAPAGLYATICARRTGAQDFRCNPWRRACLRQQPLSPEAGAGMAIRKNKNPVAYTTGFCFILLCNSSFSLENDTHIYFIH